jgi:ribonucleoside-diphosphate reductase alpha chain
MLNGVSGENDFPSFSKLLEGEAKDKEVVTKAGTVIVPHRFSDQAAYIYADKFASNAKNFRKDAQLIAKTIAEAGQNLPGGILTEKEAKELEEELTAIMCLQLGSFNSPVWYNVGRQENPQASACFILGLQDNMDSILGLQKIESQIFKSGSGTGYNISCLRAAGEALSKGGVSSGPMAFIKGQDAYAGVIRSGGKLRRAAKMVVMDIDHPDIEAFITSKSAEEVKAKLLVAAGVPEDEAYKTVAYQNINFSVRISDDFMQAVQMDADWVLKPRGALPAPSKSVKAIELFNKIAQAAWECGDPGLQFSNAINEMHTVLGTEIVSTNPCSEFVFINDSACNLASVNLAAIQRLADTYDSATHSSNSIFVKILDRLTRIFIIAQDILVDLGGYPTEAIRTNSIKYRPLGLGFTSLGECLLLRGLRYDSDSGRRFAGLVTSRMTAVAYECSQELSSRASSSWLNDESDEAKEHFWNILDTHYQMLKENELCGFAHWDTSAVWGKIQSNLSRGNYPRNAQVTLLAPTGTISFILDAATNGIEPLYSASYTKELVGGEVLKIEPEIVTKTRKRFPDAICSAIGPEAIKPIDHLLMMSACQPHLSGAISKTVNLREDATAENIKDIYFTAWKLGLKAVALYRDNSKGTQPLSSKKEKIVIPAEVKPITPHGNVHFPARQKLPKTRKALTHKFQVGSCEGYITAGMYENGSLGELFVTVSKEGSTLGGLMDAFSTVVSMALQYGVPLDALAEKMMHQRFEPAGFTGNQDFPIATSLVDYIFRWLLKEFGEKERNDDLGTDKHQAEPIMDSASAGLVKHSSDSNRNSVTQRASSTHLCSSCGSGMILQGRCHLCPVCGTSDGCS